MIWQIASKADSQARELADRHYSRQTPGATLFTPPGRTLVLKTFGAYWVTSWPYPQYVMHRWAGIWVCSAFRRESRCQELSSRLIRDAVGATRWYHLYGGNPTWQEPEPRLWVSSIGKDVIMLTFVDDTKVRPKKIYGRNSQSSTSGPGRCFMKAGFVPDGRAVNGQLAFVLPVAAAPHPEPPMEYGAMNKAARRELEPIGVVLS